MIDRGIPAIFAVQDAAAQGHPVGDLTGRLELHGVRAQVEIQAAGRMGTGAAKRMPAASVALAKCLKGIHRRSSTDALEARFTIHSAATP
jgi:hypothetical protein